VKKKPLSLLIVLMLCVICTVGITMAAVEETVTVTPTVTIPTILPTETETVMPVSAAVAVSTYTQTAQNINAGGASVYIGEQGLDLTNALNAARAAAVPETTSTQIGWWASAANIETTSPDVVVILTSATDFTVSPAFVGWYILTTTGHAAKDVAGNPVVVFNVKDPSLALKVWDYDNNADVTGGSVTQGERLGFAIETNMYSALDAKYRAPILNKTGVGVNNVGDGYMMIRVKDASATLTNLYSSDGLIKTLRYLNVSVQPYKWGNEFGNNYNWDTGSKVSASTDYVYPTGTYTVFAESWLNNMKSNYKNGGSTYTGKTVSETRTVTLVGALVASFTGSPTFGTAPLTVTFTDSSTGSPTSWIWDFGDVSSVNATQRNPVHTYVSNGTYTVSLTATNSAGSNTFTRSNYITVGSGQGQYIFTEQQNGATVYLNPTNTITLKLKDNPSTGYSWNLATTDGLQVTGNSFQSSDTTGRLNGAGGIHSWNMTVVQTGEQKISGIYSRSWEPVTGNENRFDMTIVVV
jgi:PKD repeat protein